MLVKKCRTKKRKDEYKNEEIHKLKGNSFQPFKNRQNRVA